MDALWRWCATSGPGARGTGRRPARSLRPYLVEEVLELDHALGEGETGAIRDELSDLLLHLAFQLVIAEERREFAPDDVAAGLERKMRRRHPHLFDLGEAEPWERIKRKERRGPALAGIVPTLPPLLKAYRLQERAASVGLRLARRRRTAAKVREELAEVEAELARRPRRARARPGRSQHAGTAPSDALAQEIGDLLFAVVNLARKAGVDPGSALDRANRKFRDRFEAVERLAERRGLDLDQAGLEALDRLWDEVKAGERLEVERRGPAGSRRPRPTRRPARYGYSRWICRGNAITSRMCGIPADPRDRPLDAQAEPRVHERAVPPQVEVPAVRLRVEPLLAGCARAACRSRPRAASRR